MNYQYEYIVLKARYERMKAMYESRIEKMKREIDQIRDNIIDPVLIPQFDLEMVDILTLVSKVTKVFKEDIISRKRDREIVIARSLFSYICRHHLKKQFKIIGRFINRDHSSIIYHCEVYDNYLKMNYRNETIFYNECINRINNEKA
jgi:chromosomal replication initiation ATPase DnaA